MLRLINRQGAHTLESFTQNETQYFASLQNGG